MFNKNNSDFLQQQLDEEAKSSFFEEDYKPANYTELPEEKLVKDKNYNNRYKEIKLPDSFGEFQQKLNTQLKPLGLKNVNALGIILVVIGIFTVNPLLGLIGGIIIKAAKDKEKKDK